MKYKISDLAKVLGITTNTLRRYENNGYIVPERDESDYRWYKAEDILRIAAIRLYRKCGFPHNEIMDMLNKNTDDILDICTERLNKIDEEINRLKYLRHWLKDNIQLMNTLRETGDNYIIMDCPAMKYVLYSDNDRLLTEKERLNTINMFMYHIHEVQMIYLISHDDIKNNIMPINKGWVMKEMDIERLNLQNTIKDDNPFIVDYPSRKCLYGVLEYPSDCTDNDPRFTEAKKSFHKRTTEYMLKHNFKLDGDIMAVITNIIGDKTGLLYCFPIADNN